MLKSKDAERQAEEQESGAVNVTVSKGNSRLSFVRPTLRKLTSKPRLMIVCGVVVIAIGALGFIAYKITHRPEPSNYDPLASLNMSSDPKDLLDPITRLEQKKPADTATDAEKGEYYRKLAQLNGDSGDYAKAVSIYEERMRLVPDTMTFTDYYLLAEYYKRVNRVDDSLKALDKTLELLPAKDDPNNGYYKADMVRAIEAKKQELNQ